ncbi:hypothetical protein [Kutzneria albida]|uniref:hypothetical protein n=1 Tax=Kutzneria albida TaxID=43357 RepID=UPI0004B89913|nr:hypothetical protein [Kutzneria albida]
MYMPDAPAGAVSMTPIYTSSHIDGQYRDYQLSGITWHLGDGTTIEQRIDPPASQAGA